MKHPVKNIVESVHQRLLNQYREQGGDFQGLLIRYALDRLLYRLSKSSYQDQFIVKGATLFALWFPDSHRVTKDLDLLGKGDHSIEALITTFQNICKVQVNNDGLIFNPQSVKGTRIRRDEEYEGVRITIIAKLSRSRVLLQIDVGFGDIVTPLPKYMEFPLILDFPKPILKVYPKETVIAEKLQAMINLGMANTRMKDFYDIWVLSQKYAFEGKILGKAICRTFVCRKTMLPNILPLALSDEFFESPERNSYWRAFLAKIGIYKIELSSIILDLRLFLMPLLKALANDQSFFKHWTAINGWE